MITGNIRSICSTLVSFEVYRKEALETLCGEVKTLYPEYDKGSFM